MRTQPEIDKAHHRANGEGLDEVTPAIKQGFNMLDSTEVQVSSQAAEQMFCFEGFNVRVLVKEGEPWFVAGDLCKALRLTNSRVALKALAEDEKGVSSTYTHGGAQDVAVVNEAGMWTLVLRCRDAVIEGTVPYRVRRWVTHEVLPAIRKTGFYVGKPFAVNPGDVLTQEEQNTLRLMLKTVADRQPKAKQAAVMVQGWSKLKAHFKVGYREIPRHEFSEAVSIIARHTAEWEVVDEEPTAATLNQTVADWVQKIEEKNGYPALVFMPLVEAVQRKMGIRSVTLAPSDIVVNRDKLAALWVDMGKLRNRINGMGMIESDLPPSWWQQQAIAS